MTKFKKAFNKFATKEQAKRQDILSWSKEFTKDCKWFFKQGMKQAKVVTTFPQVYWQQIDDLTIEHGVVLGRCGNEFSLIFRQSISAVQGRLIEHIVSYETGEVFDAKEFLVFPINNRREVEVTYSATGLVLGITWGGAEGTYPLRNVTSLKDIKELYVVLDTFLQEDTLTGTGDFQRELGAILVITKTTTIQVNSKPFVNTEVSIEYVGDLTSEQMKLLDSEFNI